VLLATMAPKIERPELVSSLAILSPRCSPTAGATSRQRLPSSWHTVRRVTQILSRFALRLNKIH
jgi:hypothetical protein